MIGALWTGISGLASHQAALDNEAHNIANVNTVGYKASRISFADQIYQDQIGKGSKVLDAEKVFNQGPTKLTGVAFDVALRGDGFLVVTNENSGGGTAETHFTRAGNLRMGENGTLQDAAGNEVQGWAMSTIDTGADVLSTNPNVTRFINEYTQRVSDRVINHGTFVETIAAKTTDFTKTNVGDSLEVFTGVGYKTQAGKESDIRVLTTAYADALQRYSEDPDGISTTAITQISFIDFEDAIITPGPPAVPGIIAAEGDIISVFINGNNITQEFDVDYNTTMKKLADQISEIGGLKAYIVDAAGNESTLDADVAIGRIKIENLIPGDSFTVSGVVSTSGVTEVNGEVDIANGREAVAGSGLAALESVRDKLAEAVSGKQRDVFTTTDLFVPDPAAVVPGNVLASTLTYEIDIFDKNLRTNISLPPPIPPAATVPLTINTTATTPAAALIEVAAAINLPANGFSTHIRAEIVNGALVIETLDANYDVEFNGILNRTVDGAGAPIVPPLNIEKSAHSGREGASAEFIEMKTRVDQTVSIDSLQLRLDTLGISDAGLGEFAVDTTGLITMRQDGITFAIGQLAIARFNNNRGLEPIGDNLFSQTNASGDANYSINNGRTDGVEPGNLELSDADLSESLVNLLIFQRAFEANAKSITTADQLLTALINLKQ